MAKPKPETWLVRVGTIKLVGYKDTTERRALILQCISSEGMPLKAAATFSGISKSTLDSIRERDADFSAQIDQAQAEWHRGRRRTVEQAADNGDAATARWLLERHPATREYYRAEMTRKPLVAIQVNTGMKLRVRPQ